MISGYLSDTSILQTSSYILFVQPYHEGAQNFTRAFSSDSLGLGCRITHIIAGTSLIFPLVNTIALIAIKSLILYSYSSQKPLFPSEKNQFFAGKFIDHIFDSYTTIGKDPNQFSVISENGELFVKSTEIEEKAPLNKLIEAIDWEKLPAKWIGLTPTQLENYKIYTLIRSKKDVLNDLANEIEEKLPALKGKKHPFLKMYTQDFYSIINSLLRDGQILLESCDAHQKGGSSCTQELLIPQYSRMLEALLGIQNNKPAESLDDPQSTDLSRFVKEVLFISLLTAGSLQAIPFSETAVLHRVLTLPIQTVNLWKLAVKINQPITDRGFCSTSHGGRFTGAPTKTEGKQFVRCTIKRSKNGRDLSAIGLGGEKEFLFRPFTRFKVLQVNEKTNLVDVELEEIV